MTDALLLLHLLCKVVLSELLNVPTTVETLHPDDTGGSLYDPTNKLTYGKQAYPYDALRKGNEFRDCRLTNEPCAHVVSETERERE